MKKSNGKNDLLSLASIRRFYTSVAIVTIVVLFVFTNVFIWIEGMDFVEEREFGDKTVSKDFVRVIASGIITFGVVFFLLFILFILFLHPMSKFSNNSFLFAGTMAIFSLFISIFGLLIVLFTSGFSFLRLFMAILLFSVIIVFLFFVSYIIVQLAILSICKHIRSTYDNNYKDNLPIIKEQENKLNKHIVFGTVLEFVLIIGVIMGFALTAVL